MFHLRLPYAGSDGYKYDGKYFTDVPSSVLLLRQVSFLQSLMFI